MAFLPHRPPPAPGLRAQRGRIRRAPGCAHRVPAPDPPGNGNAATGAERGAEGILYEAADGWAWVLRPWGLDKGRHYRMWTQQNGVWEQFGAL